MLKPPANSYAPSCSRTWRPRSSTPTTSPCCLNSTVTNRAPVAAADTYTTAEDTNLMVDAPGVLGNDSDPDGNQLSAVLGSGPSHGTIALNGNGSFTYTPAPNVTGTDSF